MKFHLIALVLAIGQVITTTSAESLDCGKHDITSGEIYPIVSPNYPDDYGKKDSCKWEFTCDESNGVIGISCDDFKTEEDDPCKKADYLKVSDSTGTIDYFCGKSGPDLESADNFLELKFGTDEDKKVKGGFNCSVVCTVKTDTPESTTTLLELTTSPALGPLDCGEHTITSGEIYPIVSPNYPDDYGKKDSCKWEFTCDESNGVIGISCDDFKTEENDSCKKADYLKVSDSTGLIDYFCGDIGPDFESGDNFLELKFSTDNDKKVKKGFSCSVICTAKTTTTETTTTTTEPTTTTTTPEPTTPVPTTTIDPSITVTPSGGWSGNCSKEITASAGMKEYWVSPKYDGTTHYPKGEYCCSLNVTIPTTYNMMTVTMVMQSPSAIYETSQCVHDNIKYTSSDGTESTLCGQLSDQSWTEAHIFASDATKFSFTWCSHDADGHTDIGFKMEITAKDLMNP